MPSVNTTMYKKIRLLGLVWLTSVTLAKAQTINSPYSRYGLGDLVPSQNILTRGMGGLSAAFWDPLTINFLNPASYGRLGRTALDIGLELDNRTLRTTDPPRKFNAYSPTISYVQFAFPVKQGGGWGFNLGIRPISRINYKIERPYFTPGPDSVRSLFEGNGGAYEVHAGTGFTLFKNLSIGINGGYFFGTKDFSTRTSIVNDTVTHTMSNHETKSNYGGFVTSAGLQYRAKIGKTSWLRLGAYGNLQQTLKGTRDRVVETFQYNVNTGEPISIDSVYYDGGEKGDVIYPATYGAGIIFEKELKWMLGVDYTETQWKEYSYFGEKDPLRSSWTVRIGAQLYPTNGTSYWRRVFYRAGFNFGTDYISLDKDLPTWSASVGMGLPMRPPAYSNQFSIINLSLEVGSRGRRTNLIRENFFRIGVGLSLSDIWFLKRKFD
jgi:hypothetical protein